MISTANFSPHDLPLGRIYHWEKAHADEVFLTQPTNGITRDWTWAETMDESRRMASHLLAQKWTPGSHIVIFSKNCSWWIMAEFAIWMAGHVTVPIYPSLTAASARQLFQHCDPVACFYGNLETPTLAQESIPENIHRIRFPNAADDTGLNWNAVVDATQPLSTNPERSADDIATIIYTSGTTGTPKGAVHRFFAFPFIAKAVAQVTGEKPHRALSYLPLAHIAERGLTETMAIYYSWHLFFNEGIPTFLTDLKRAKPTVFFSVPRLYAKFQQRVLDRISRNTLERLQGIPMVDSLIGKYLLNTMGLIHVEFAASGSAALPSDLLQWFLGLGFPLTEGYGTTETGITHTAPNGESRPGFAGKSAPFVETKLSEMGEVLLRSPMNMVGYYKNAEETKKLFTEDGFIHTGDLGELTADGWLRIIGRIKEQFKTGKGKYVSPGKIEGLLSAHSAVEHCLVFGASNMSQPCAVVVLTTDAVRKASTDEGRSALQTSFQELLESINSQVEPHEELAFVALVKDRWSIDSGFLTPTLKLRRTPLEAFYAASVPAWLNQGNRIVWHLTA
jgi:long-chain acyl-CoA synthetase